MIRKNTFLLILLTVCAAAFSQNEKLIRGRITVSDATALGVNILNLVNEKEAVSDANGEFSILAKPDDVLVFSAVHLDLMRRIIEKEDYDSGFFIQPMTAKINELDEVEIKDIRLDAVKLGILAKAPKRYTVAERRLYTARSGPLDEVLNLLNGRIRMLKRAAQAEKKETLLRKLDGLYEERFYIEKLCIEKESIVAFHYFLVENGEFADALLSKNKLVITPMITGLAKKYNDLQSDGPK